MRVWRPGEQNEARVVRVDPAEGSKQSSLSFVVGTDVVIRKPADSVLLDVSRLEPHDCDTLAPQSS